MKSLKPSLLQAFFTSDEYAFSERLCITYDNFGMSFLGHTFQQKTTIAPGPEHEFLGLYFNLKNNFHAIRKNQFNLIYVPDMPAEVELPRGTSFMAIAIRMSKEYLMELAEMFPLLENFAADVQNKKPAQLCAEHLTISADIHDLFHDVCAFLLEQTHQPAEIFLYLSCKIPETVLLALDQISAGYDPAKAALSDSWPQVMEAHRYMKENFRKRITLADLAYLAGINKDLLEQEFKKMYHTSVHDYLIIVRINKAGELLRDTDLPLRSIAHRVGYSSLSNFSITFKRKTGHSPAAYRRRLRKPDRL